ALRERIYLAARLTASSRDATAGMAWVRMGPVCCRALPSLTRGASMHQSCAAPPISSHKQAPTHRRSATKLQVDAGRYRINRPPSLERATSPLACLHLTRRITPPDGLRLSLTIPLVRLLLGWLPFSTVMQRTQPNGRPPMKDIPLRDELETTLKKVAKEIRKRVHGVKTPKSLETPLKQSIEAVHNAVVFGKEMVAKKSGRKTSTKKANAKKTSARKTSATKPSSKPGTKQRGAKKRSRTKSGAKQS